MVAAARHVAVAVTGGAGFLGSAIADGCAARGHAVTAIDRAAGRPRDGVESVVIDVMDTEALAGWLADVHVVVHAAAIAGVDAVRAELRAATAVNVLGALSVLTAASTAGVGRIVDLSSEEVYGTGEHALTGGALAEDARLMPLSAYGVHKLAVELLAREFPDVHYVAARMSWVYGDGFPRQRPPQPWLDAARAGSASAPGPGADHTADLIHVDDAVGAVIALVEADRLEHHAYNVGSGTGVAMRDVVAHIRRIRPSWGVALASGTLRGIAERPPLSIERIREELGWTPDLSLEEGLRRTLHGR